MVIFQELSIKIGGLRRIFILVLFTVITVNEVLNLNSIILYGKTNKEG
jgi:hypothetical protein